MPDALYELAWRHLSADTPDKARPLFARLVKEFPTHALAADAGFRLGEEEYRAGNYAAAAAHYRPAAEASHPVAEKAGYKLGWSLRRTGDHAGAAKAFAAVAARFPKGELTPESRVRAGEAYLELEQEASALPEFEAVLAREPQTEAERTLALEARVGAAHAYLMKGDFDKARSLVEEAADPAKGWIGARAHMVRAEAIFLKEGAKAALAEYARGAARFGKFPDAVAEFRYRAAECYEKLGNLPLARKTWQRVVELSGETEWAARSREKLKASPAAPKAPAGASLR